MQHGPELFELGNDAFHNRESRGLGTVKYDGKKEKYVYREPSPSLPDDAIETIPNEHYINRKELGDNELTQFRNRGFEAILNGELGVLCLCGGQATRLGGDLPKGIFDLGLGNPYSNLLRIQAGYICRLKHLAQNYANGLDNSETSKKVPRLPWYVMVSNYTKARVEEELKSVCKAYGIPEDEIIVLVQNEVPAFDCEGSVMYSNKDKLATSPNGNGGLFEVLQQEENMNKMAGIKYIHVYCVDNILCRVGDPVFVGMCISKNAECAAKIVEKVDEDEKVGVVVKANGHFRVLEYTELPPAIRKARTEDNRLKFRAGSIANHFFSVDFLNRVRSVNLPYHLAQKNIPCYNLKSCQRTTEKGYKLERFIFDVFPECDPSKFFVFQVDREEEFAPLKNAEGPDSPHTCRDAIHKLHLSWLKSINFSPSSSAPPALLSPFTTYEGEGLTVELCRQMETEQKDNCWMEANVDLVKNIYETWPQQL